MAADFGDAAFTTGNSIASAAAANMPTVNAGDLVRVDLFLSGQDSAMAPVGVTGSVSGAYDAASANPKQATTTWTQYTFYQRVTGPETLSFEWIGTRIHLIVVSTWTGTDPTTPVASTAGGTATTGAVPSGTFTPGATGKTASVVAATRNSDAGAAWTPSAGLTEVETFDGGTSPVRHAFVGKGSPGAAATSYTMTASPAPVAGAAITLVLNPAPDEPDPEPVLELADLSLSAPAGSTATLQIAEISLTAGTPTPPSYRWVKGSDGKMYPRTRWVMSSRGDLI